MSSKFLMSAKTGPVIAILLNANYEQREGSRARVWNPTGTQCRRLLHCDEPPI